MKNLEISKPKKNAAKRKEEGGASYPCSGLYMTNERPDNIGWDGLIKVTNCLKTVFRSLFVQCNSANAKIDAKTKAIFQ